MFKLIRMFAEGATGAVKAVGRSAAGAISAAARFLGVVDTSGARPQPRGNERQRAEQRRTERERFSARLRDAVRRQETPTAAAFYLINLKSLKAHFGERWPDVAEKVDVVARRVIELRTSKADMYLGVDGPMFLVLFDRLDEAAARVKSAMIAAEIESKLLGAGVPGVAVRAGAGRFDPRLIVDPIDPRSLAEELSATRPAVAGTKAEQGGSAGTSEGRAADLLWQAMPERPSRALNAWYQAAKPDLRMVIIDRPAFVYRPMWNVRHQAVSTFHCFAQTSSVNGRVLTYTEPFSALKLDLYTLQQAIKDLKKGFNSGTPFIIGLSVHFSSLVAPRVGQTFRTACELIPEQLRQRLVCEIMALPEGVPSPRLQEAVAIAKRYFRAVNVRLSLARPDVASVSGSGALAVGADCSADRVDENKVIGYLNQFAEKAERYGFQSYAHGMNSVSQTVGAMSAGFQYIGGSPVGRGQFPERMYRFMLEDIYSGVMAQGAADHARETV